MLAQPNSYIMSEEVIIPEVGMGATRSSGSDSYPYSIVKVISEKKIVVQADNATPAEGFDYYSNQVYDYSPNYEAALETFTLRKNGTWMREGTPMKNYWSAMFIGRRSKRRDPHF